MMNDSEQTFNASNVDVAALSRLRREIGTFARQFDEGGTLGDDVETVVAEVLDNICEHNPAETKITVRVSRKGAMFQIEFRDQGLAFDPLAAVAVDQEIGGLGIQIVRSLAEELSYHRSSNDENVFTVQFLISQ